MTRRRGRPRHPDVLTPSEWSVLDLYRHGLPQHQIARLRGTGRDAVRYHLRAIRDKLASASVRELRNWAGIPEVSPLRHSARRARRIKTMNSQPILGDIGQVSLLCRRAASTEAWYRDVLRLHHLYTYGSLVFFDCHGTRLYFREVPDAEWRQGSTIYFDVPDITAAHQVLADRGVAFHGAPHLVHRHEDGAEEWMAFFDDPDGNLLALMSKVSPS